MEVDKKVDDDDDDDDEDDDEDEDKKVSHGRRYKGYHLCKIIFICKNKMAIVNLVLL